MYLNTSKDSKSTGSKEMRISPIETPKFHCFTDLGLGEKPPDPEEIFQAIERKRRETERKAHKIKVDRMYKLAMANSATAQRILAKHVGETGLDLEGNETSAISDMACSLVPVKAKNNEDHNVDSERPWLKYLRPKRILPIQEVSESESDDKNEEKLLAIEPAPISPQNNKAAGKSKSFLNAQPLTLASLGREKTIEAKCPKTIWMNYI